MTIEAGFLQELTYGAEETRRAIYALYQRGASIGSVEGGGIGLNDFTFAVGSGLHVTVGAGEAIIPGSSSATQSGYYFRNTTTETLAIATANASLPRIDRVSALIKDKAYTGSENKGELAVQTGTATAGATLTNLNGVAAAPTSSLTIGYVLVPAAASSLESADLKPVITYIQLGIFALQVTPQASYSIKAGRTIGTEYEPSTARATQVSVVMTTASGSALTAAVTVGTTTFAEYTVPAVASHIILQSCQFICPPTLKWKVTGSFETLESSYLVL